MVFIVTHSPGSSLQRYPLRSENQEHSKDLLHFFERVDSTILRCGRYHETRQTDSYPSQRKNPCAFPERGAPFMATNRHF